MPQTLFGVGRVVAKPGQAEELKTALLEVVAETRKEPGNLHFDLYQGDPATDVFIIEGSWISRAALKDHIATAHVQRFFSRAEELAIGPLDLTTLAVVDRIAVPNEPARMV